MVSRQLKFAKKSLGQNFLTDQDIIKKIVDALALTAADTVIEIGPGRGALTEHLIEKAGKVIAIELDRELVPFLRDKFAGYANFVVHEEDALEINFEALIGKTVPPADAGGSDVKLVANLPYYISTAILQRLAEQRSSFSSLVLMFQREVVERISAKPGDSERGFLTVLIEAAFSVERLFDVPPTAFQPVPKVWSSVVCLVPKSKSIGDEESFRDLVSAAFGQKRKTILNNLKGEFPLAGTALAAAGIDPSRRAESLLLEEWLRLSEAIHGE